MRPREFGGRRQERKGRQERRSGWGYFSYWPSASSLRALGRWHAPLAFDCANAPLATTSAPLNQRPPLETAGVGVSRLRRRRAVLFFPTMSGGYRRYTDGVAVARGGGGAPTRPAWRLGKRAAAWRKRVLPIALQLIEPHEDRPLKRRIRSRFGACFALSATFPGVSPRALARASVGLAQLAPRRVKHPWRGIKKGR